MCTYPRTSCDACLQLHVTLKDMFPCIHAQAFPAIPRIFPAFTLTPHPALWLRSFVLSVFFLHSWIFLSVPYQKFLYPCWHSLAIHCNGVNVPENKKFHAFDGIRTRVTRYVTVGWSRPMLPVVVNTLSYLSNEAARHWNWVNQYSRPCDSAVQTATCRIDHLCWHKQGQPHGRFCIFKNSSCAMRKDFFLRQLVGATFDQKYLSANETNMMKKKR